MLFCNGNNFVLLQISDFDGNTYSLCLLTRVLESCKWLKCLKRCYSSGSYNVVAYNTPKGVVLETVSGVAVGAELCVAYDHSYGKFRIASVSQNKRTNTFLF